MVQKCVEKAGEVLTVTDVSNVAVAADCYQGGNLCYLCGVCLLCKLCSKMSVKLVAS